MVKGTNVRNRNMLGRMGHKNAGMTRKEWLQKTGLAAAGVGAAAVGLGGTVRSVKAASVPVQVPAPTGNYPEDFDAIQDAIDAANPGAIIQLQPGEYNLGDDVTGRGSLFIPKGISLIGAGKDLTVLKGGGAPRIFTPEGTPVQHTIISFANLPEFNPGEELKPILISGFHMKDGRGSAVDIIGSVGTEISNLRITNVKQAPFLGGITTFSGGIGGSGLPYDASAGLPDPTQENTITGPFVIKDCDIHPYPSSDPGNLSSSDPDHPEMPRINTPVVIGWANTSRFEVENCNITGHSKSIELVWINNNSPYANGSTQGLTRIKNCNLALRPICDGANGSLMIVGTKDTIEIEGNTIKVLEGKLGAYVPAIGVSTSNPKAGSIKSNNIYGENCRAGIYLGPITPIPENYGYTVDAFNGGTVSNNKIRGSGKHAIAVINATDCSIFGNEVNHFELLYPDKPLCNPDNPGFEFTPEPGISTEGGYFDEAIRLIDQDFVELPNNDSTNSPLDENELTISAWVKFGPGALEEDRFKPIVTKGDECIGLKVQDVSKKFEFVIYDGTFWQLITSDAPAMENTWYHIVGTYDGLNLQMYIDGVKQSETAPCAQIDPSPAKRNTPLRLGDNADITDRHFGDGWLDDVAIWNRALGDAEVVDLAGLVESGQSSSYVPFALYDEDVDFIGSGVLAGMKVYNFTNGKLAIVTENPTEPHKVLLDGDIFNEIGMHYCINTLPTSHPDYYSFGLVAYYSCDDGTLYDEGNFQKLQDLSGNGNHGIVNFASCPPTYEPALFYLGPNALDSTVRGNTGGSVWDEPDFDPEKFVYFGNFNNPVFINLGPGFYMISENDFNNVENVLGTYYNYGGAGCGENLLACDDTNYINPYAFERGDYYELIDYGTGFIPGFHVVEKAAIKLVSTLEPFTTHWGESIPSPLLYNDPVNCPDPTCCFLTGGNCYPCCFGWSFNASTPVTHPKNNLITGLEPMKGAGGVAIGSLDYFNPPIKPPKHKLTKKLPPIPKNP